MGYYMTGTDYPQLTGFFTLAGCPKPFIEYPPPKPPSALKTDLSQTLMQGYPYVFNYVKPYEPPERDGASANGAYFYIGSLKALTVTFAKLLNVISGDVLVLRLISGGSVLHTETNALTPGSSPSASVSVGSIVLNTIAAGVYDAEAFIRRGQAGSYQEYCHYAFAYSVVAFPSVQVSGVSPSTVQKPVGALNKDITLAYKVVGEGVTEILNTFDIAGFGASELIKQNELMVVESDSRTNSIYDATMNFTVTDPDFKLVSFKFLFGLYNSSTEVDYRIDGVTVQ